MKRGLLFCSTRRTIRLRYCLGFPSLSPLVQTSFHGLKVSRQNTFVWSFFFFFQNQKSRVIKQNTLFYNYKDPVIWSNRVNTLKLLPDETQEHDDYSSGMPNGCLAVVPWVPNSQHSPEFAVCDAETSDMMDSDAMDVKDNCNAQQMPNHHNDNYVVASATQDWNQWQQHCMIQQPPNNLSTPITWLGGDSDSLSFDRNAGVFTVVFVAATMNAIVISLLISLAAVGGFLAIFFACMTTMYILLYVTAFVTFTVTISSIIAALVAAGIYSHFISFSVISHILH
ncbi:hypothetical protein HanOQP8_Chr01g0010301 [Helianthus annuus]|nr:hypothetical protein HanOQP8_Chr01g0010301 [Helianthus annuus]